MPKKFNSNAERAQIYLDGGHFESAVPAAIIALVDAVNKNTEAIEKQTKIIDEWYLSTRGY